MDLGAFIKSDKGKVLISIILGLGLATLFRKVCKDSSCIVIKGPKVSDVKDKYYKIEDKCYKYTPFVTPCNEEETIVKA